MIGGAERVGQVFRVDARLFLVVGQEYHDESSQTVWTLVDLEGNRSSVASEGYLGILERQKGRVL